MRYNKSSGADAMKWRRVECEGEGPGARYAAQCVALPDDDSVLVYGGKNDNEAFNDLYRLRFTTEGLLSNHPWRVPCVG
jgi:hypothetical protein